MKNFEKRLKEANDYINQSVKEGYMFEDDAFRLEMLPKEEMIKACEELGARGDAEMEDAAAGEYHSLGEKDE